MFQALFDEFNNTIRKRNEKALNILFHQKSFQIHPIFEAWICVALHSNAGEKFAWHFAVHFGENSAYFCIKLFRRTVAALLCDNRSSKTRFAIFMSKRHVHLSSHSFVLCVETTFFFSSNWRTFYISIMHIIKCVIKSNSVSRKNLFKGSFLPISFAFYSSYDKESLAS